MVIRNFAQILLIAALPLASSCALAGEPDGPQRVDPTAPAQQLDQELKAIESYILNPRPRRLTERQRARDLEVDEQRLKSLSTSDPRNPKLPLLNRQLDRLQRPTTILRPQDRN